MKLIRFRFKIISLVSSQSVFMTYSYGHKVCHDEILDRKRKEVPQSKPTQNRWKFFWLEAIGTRTNGRIFLIIILNMKFDTMDSKSALLNLFWLKSPPPSNIIFKAQQTRLFLFGSQRRWSLSLPILTLIFPALLPCLVRDSLCTALQTKILWINWSLNAIDTIETWVSGNLTALTERLQPAIRWTRGRGGESCVWRLFPWRTLISTYSEPW